MSQKRRKIYHVVSTCAQLLKSFSAQGHERVVFNAFLSKNGKKLNSIEKADVLYISQLLRDYDKSENPDKVKIEFRNADSNTFIWGKEFSLSDTEETLTPTNFQGLGENEINDLVQRRLSDYEKQKENESLQAQLEELTAENEELKGLLDEATTTLDAKKQVEYYANLLGMAMPGLAKMLGKTQAGQALGFLSGTEEEPAHIESPKTETDSRTAILQLIDEYLHSLDNAVLGNIYLICCEWSKDAAQIGKTLQMCEELNVKRKA